MLAGLMGPNHVEPKHDFSARQSSRSLFCGLRYVLDYFLLTAGK
jgi:hypothetical protein